jgi:SAM-dependent methyltransferase
MGTDAAFWDRAAAAYARKPIKDTAGYERTLARIQGHLSSGASVLEVGCGTGMTAARLAPGVRRYLASDVSEKMIEIGRGRLGDGEAPNLAFHQADLHDPALEGPWDAVLALNVLHVVEDAPRAVRRIGDLVGPGGLFVSKTACLAEGGLAIRLLIRLMRLVGRAPRVSVLRAADLEAAVREAGFDILESEDAQASPRVRFLIARKR